MNEDNKNVENDIDVASSAGYKAGTIIGTAVVACLVFLMLVVTAKTACWIWNL